MICLRIAILLTRGTRLMIDLEISSPLIGRLGLVVELMIANSLMRQGLMIQLWTSKFVGEYFCWRVDDLKIGLAGGNRNWCSRLAAMILVLMLVHKLDHS